MTQPALNQLPADDGAGSQWRMLCRAGGVAALAQEVCVVITMIVSFTVGVEPATAAEYYTMLQNDRLTGLLRLDFPTLILICLFAVTAFGIYAALRRRAPAYAALAAALIYTGMILALANHSAFAMIRLSDLHAAATNLTEKFQLLTVGEAVIAADMWHSTAGFVAGIFMQGAFVFISVVMLRTPEFGKATAITGLLANGLDLLHVFVALFAPLLATILLSIGGVFYLVWFPLLGWDLLKQGRKVM